MSDIIEIISKEYPKGLGKPKRIEKYITKHGGIAELIPQEQQEHVVILHGRLNDGTQVTIKKQLD